MVSTENSGLTWLIYVLMTACCWGMYGILLHKGQVMMQDSENALFKAFLWVGIAYCVTAVVAPLAVLVIRGASWSYTSGGITFSLLAGIAGALGAFGVLLAFNAKGMPAVVMSIIFGIAPLINAIISFILHPPPGGLKSIPVPFLMGIFMLACGGFLVAKFKPPPGKPVPIETTLKR